VSAVEAVFVLLSLVALGSALLVVTTSNLVHAALWLVVTLGAVAGLYLVLAAEFVAWVQVLIYIGAIVILFLFGIMLTRAPMRPEGSMDNSQRLAAAIVSLFLFGVITALFVDAYHGKEIKLSDDLVLIGNSGHIASDIFRNYLVPFEVVSMLLLAALVGAVVIARRD